MDDGWMDAALQDWREHHRAESLGELLKAHRDRAYGIALRLMGSSADAEDVVQEAFVKLLDRTHGFESLSEFQITVYRAITQCGLDALRKRKRRMTREAGAQDSGEQGVHQSQPVAEQQETQALLRSAVTALPEDERVPVVLCYYQGLSVMQTARTLELPRETVRARLGRALEKLRQSLKGHGRDIGAAVIAGLLWQDSAGGAPATLCSALDRALPGRECSQIPPLCKPAVDPSALPQGVSTAHVVAGSAVAILLIGVAIISLNFSQPAAAEKTLQPASAITKNSGAEATGAPQNPIGPVQGYPTQTTKEEQAVNSKLAAAVLTGGLVLAGGAKAGDGDAKSVIAKIEARRAEKAAAEAKAAKRAAQAEASESSESEGAERTVIQLGPGAPGGTIIIGGDRD